MLNLIKNKSKRGLTVFFEQKLSEQFEKIDTVYDLAAFCYDYLVRTVGNQARFLGKYIMENENAQKSNPNLQELLYRSSMIEHIMQNREEFGWSFSECLIKIQLQLKNTILIEYEDSVLNDAAIAFFILMAIDRYILSKKDNCTDKAPLNKKYCEESYIYLNVKDSLLDKAAEANNFSDVILDSSIRNQLRHLIILEKRDLPEGMNPPSVVGLFLNKEKRKLFVAEKLKIAVIPFGQSKMVKFPVVQGGLFQVAYEDEHLKSGVERAVKLLETAIDNGANVIVFPEFVCNQAVQNEIQKVLLENYRDKEKRKNCLNCSLWLRAAVGWMETIMLPVYLVIAVNYWGSSINFRAFVIGSMKDRR